MKISVQQTWALNRFKSSHKLILKDFVGSRGEIFVEVVYRDKTTQLFYRITKRGKTSLVKEIHHIEMVWKQPHKNKGRGIYLENVLE
jgi:hypothetical protein